VNHFTGTRAVEPGYTGLGALLNLTETAAAIKKQLRVDHLTTGRFLYILLDGSPASDSLEFRDFPMGRKYSIQLLQSSTSKGAEASSSFHIAVTIEEKDGRVHRLTVGNPQIQRAGVKAYHIKQIILTPDGKSHVFVIQKEEADDRGDNVRYMVETVRIP
jgi:predicted secreted protein